MSEDTIQQLPHLDVALIPFVRRIDFSFRLSISLASHKMRHYDDRIMILDVRTLDFEEVFGTFLLSRWMAHWVDLAKAAW